MITKVSAKDVIKYLKSYEGKILLYLEKVIKSKIFNYKTFGTDIEVHLTDVITKILKEGGFIKSDADYVIAPNKNYFPDFKLNTVPPLAIEFKSGNKSQIRKGKWVAVKNSENDMGTLNDWPRKIIKFGGDNIYYVFVIYNFNIQVKEVLKVEIAPFYYFMDLNKGKVLKYREKDGNLRPKDFADKPPIKTLKQFEKLLNRTNIYRSQRVIKRHRLIIKEATKNAKKEQD